MIWSRPTQAREWRGVAAVLFSSAAPSDKTTFNLTGSTPFYRSIYWAAAHKCLDSQLVAAVIARYVDALDTADEIRSFVSKLLLTCLQKAQSTPIP